MIHVKYASKDFGSHFPPFYSYFTFGFLCAKGFLVSLAIELSVRIMLLNYLFTLSPASYLHVRSLYYACKWTMGSSQCSSNTSLY